jgi:L-fuculose-phosphate aldolase
LFMLLVFRRHDDRPESVSPGQQGESMKKSNIRQEIVEMAFLLLEERLVIGTAGNISARCPDGLSFFITPTGWDYRLLTKRDLVRVHLASGSSEGRHEPSSEWRLHRAIYEARSDVNAIIHHHATWASAVAVARKTIPVLIEEAADLGPISTAPYAPSGSQELAEAVSVKLAQRSNAVLLANHGAVVVGRHLGEAMHRALEVERLAKIYIGAELLGGAHALDEPQIIRSQKFLAAYQTTQTASRTVRPVGFRASMYYGFQVCISFAYFVQSLILQKLQRS